MNIYPLMIGGCPRSGTTALVQIFNSNPSVHISSEENLLNADRVLRKLLGTRERRAQVVHKMGERELSPRETLNSGNILTSNFTEKAVWPMLRELYKWHHGQKHSIPLVLWGDKFPNYCKEIDNVLAIPEVRYLHITRNPFDVVNSMLRRTAMAKEGKDWWKAITDIDDMINAWCEAYNAVSRAQSHEKVFHIHYEELVFDFDNSIKNINEFLGVDLKYKNLMVDIPEKHYDRTFLNRDIISRMMKRPEVSSYVEKYSNNAATPNVSKSLNEIVQMKNKVYMNSGSNTEPVRVFVAATPAEWLPARVLEFSIREKTDLAVDVSFLYQSGIDIPVPDNPKNRPRTPFSFQRFLIPELCEYQGRAIYLDADMQVFKDITELWNYPLDEADLLTVKDGGNGRKGQFSVMLLDCARLKWDIKAIVEKLNSGDLDYAGLMYEMKVAPEIGKNIDPKWNSLESFKPATTALLHYTDMNTQPWISLANPLGYLWVSCLKRAISFGFITREEVEREVRAGHIRPSLLSQLDLEVDDTIVLPSKVKKLDRDFTAPYKNLRNGRARPWTSIVSALYWLTRQIYYRSPLPRIFR